MKKAEVNQLNTGLYKIYWKKEKGGGSSLASVGITKNGDRWIAPTNWISGSATGRTWLSVERVELLASRDASAPTSLMRRLVKSLQNTIAWANMVTLPSVSQADVYDTEMKEANELTNKLLAEHG